MLLQDKQSGELVEVLDPQALEALFNPSEKQIAAKLQAGQEEQDATSYSKESLKFPSGEELPRCWLDAGYRMAQK